MVNRDTYVCGYRGTAVPDGYSNVMVDASILVLSSLGAVWLVGFVIGLFL